MKKNKFCFLFVLAAMALVFSACIFESDEDGLGSWLSNQGMPSNYKVQTLSVDNIEATSFVVHLDTTPRSADGQAMFGHVSSLTHDLVLDFGYAPDSAFLAKYKKDSDSSGAVLLLYWLRDYYKNKWFPKDSLPLKDEFDVKVSWKLEKSSRSSFLDSINEIADSTWYKELASWKPSASADTVLKVKMNLSKGDTALRLELPSALVKELKTVKKNARLQLRISAPKAARGYRLWGSASDYPPLLVMHSKSDYDWAPAFRMAGIVKNEEECPECLVLHGGVVDSLVVELPPEPILNALSEFYGDEFPFKDGNGNDVRQTVIHAQLTMPRDDAQGQNELGLPIQVVVGSYVDSADLVIRRMEEFRRDTAVIKESGYQNLVFHEGDSLTLQLTYGFRDFINRAADGRKMKFMMRLGFPFLQEKLPFYKDTILTTKKKVVNANGDTTVEVKKDTVYKFLAYQDYARYDFSTLIDKPMTLKLWLASKRGDE